MIADPLYYPPCQNSLEKLILIKNASTGSTWQTGSLIRKMESACSMPGYWPTGYGTSFGKGLAPDLTDFGGQGTPPDHPELGQPCHHSGRERLGPQSVHQGYSPQPDLPPGIPPPEGYKSFQLARDYLLNLCGIIPWRSADYWWIKWRPSVKPFQPTGYYRHLNFPKRTYEVDSGESQWRRGLYVHWQRQFLHPMLKAFDAPSREECSAERPQSNHPSGCIGITQ